MKDALKWFVGWFFGLWGFFFLFVVLLKGCAAVGKL